ELLVLAGVVTFLTFRSQRKLITVLAIVAARVLAVSAPYVLKIVEAMGEERSEEWRPKVIIDEREVRYTNAISRGYPYDVCRLAIAPRAQGVLFLGALGRSILATMLLMLTVWMPHDFGFWLLWCSGAGAGLRGNVRAPFLQDDQQSLTVRSTSPASPDRHRR